MNAISTPPSSSRLTPERAKWIAIACGLYTLVPDIIPILGEFDDLLAMATAVLVTRNAARKPDGAPQ